MRAKLLIARQSYSLETILNCRYCTPCKKLDGLVIIGKEQILQLMKLAISYSPDKTERIYSILLSLPTQPLAQKGMAIWFEIVLIDSVIAKIGILHLSPISIQAHILERQFKVQIINIYPYPASWRGGEYFKIYSLVLKLGKDH